MAINTFFLMGSLRAFGLQHQEGPFILAREVMLKENIMNLNNKGGTLN